MATTLARRDVLGLAGALGLGKLAVGLVSLPGCGIYEAESGDAFAPWDFPGGERAPERVIARAALLASSPHNTQPWALSIEPSRIELRARLDRNLGAMDGLRREMYVGLGCAIENMAVAAPQVGRSATVELLPVRGDDVLVARLALAPAAPTAAPLFDAIARRHTNRGRYLDAPAASALEPALRDLVRDAGVELHFLGAPDQRRAFADATIAATEAIIADAEMSADSDRWYRHSEEEILEKRDGTTLDATGNGASTRTLGKAFSRPSAETANSYWLDGTRARQTTGSAFVILSSRTESTREDQLRVGRVYQRMHLWATTQRLAMQPLNQLAERQDREEVRGLEPVFTRRLAGWVGDRRRAQMLFRIGYPWDEAFASPRRPLEWVIA
ncbi:MAG: hypothetical protein JST00_14245 [Deltaproteobacteria bacterium]|nr:hypothetical protein [Deltaproteobacteria bacterium]